MSLTTTYTLRRATLSAVLREDDITVDNVARIFKITQSSIYLIGDQGVAIFPSTSGFFSSLDLMSGGGTFQVMGDEMSAALPNSCMPSAFIPSPGQSRPRFSFSRSATATVPHTPQPATTKTYQRTIFLGQLQGDKIIQNKALVIPFEEAEACLSTMTKKVKEALGLGLEEKIILTDSQGNLLLDTPGTKGSAYWKQSSRRLFAVKEDVYAEMGKRKKRKLGQASRQEGSELLEIKDKIEEVLLASEGLTAVSAKLRELCKQSEEILRTSFRCSVCRGVMDSPVLARCCRSLVGCQQCVEQVLQEGQSCVKCRSAITGESLVPVAGLSELLNVIRAIVEQYNSE